MAAVDSWERTPLHFAVATGRRPRSPSRALIYSGKARVIEALFEYKADPNARNMNHETPLDYCASSRKCKNDVVGLLLDAGADFMLSKTEV